MATLVVLHVAFRAEAETAFGALEWALIVVDSLMDFQVLLLRKALAARGKRADEGLRAVVDMHVGFETDFSFEVLATTFVWAGELLLTLAKLFCPLYILQSAKWMFFSLVRC